jgi:ATP-binding cassette, subfamily B, bacterial CvaB/MchF/RaxB
MFFNKPKRIVPVLQGANSECGLACVTMALNWVGSTLALSDMRRRYPQSLRGTTIKTLIAMCEDFNVACRPLRLELRELQHLRTPSILHWDFDHFVVLEACNSHFVDIIDPKIGRRRLRTAQVSEHFTGIALEIAASSRSLDAVAHGHKLKVGNLFTGVGQEIKRILLSLIFVTLAIDCLALILPMLLKVVFDKVVPTNNFAVLRLAVLGFLVTAVAQFVLQVIRAGSLATFRGGLSAHLSDFTFTNLIWNRARFFEERTPGKIANQYRSVTTITSTLSELLISRIIDGLAVGIGVAVAIVFAWKEALTILCTICTYAVVAIRMNRELRSRLCELIHAEGHANQYFLETVSSVQTIKLYSNEMPRIATWKNICDTVQHASARLGTYRANMYSLLELATGLGWIGVIYLLVMDLASNHVTIGVFTAMVSWTSFILLKARDITLAASEVISLEEHVNRIDDIVAYDKETYASTNDHQRSDSVTMAAGLSLEHVSFRYDKDAPWILQDCSLCLPIGQMTVVRGESGAGKTTLLKVVLGLLSPVKGSLLLGNHSLSASEFPQLRRQCAAVLQNDTLFMGSLRDNISLFDVTPDEALIQECAKQACIDEWIQSLPMKYDSLVTREGAGFSAGQIQRIVLARALYRRPTLLVLDEFTSNLDEATESKLLANIRAMKITTLTAAHRPSIVAFADNVFEVSSGRLRPIRHSTASVALRVSALAAPIDDEIGALRSRA